MGKQQVCTISTNLSHIDRNIEYKVHTWAHFNNKKSNKFI